MSKEIFSPATLPPPTGYSHIAKVNKGTLVYMAGQVSADASGKLVGEGDLGAQSEQVFKNLKLALEAAGATMADVVKMNTYLVAEVEPGRSAEDARGPRTLYEQGQAAREHAGRRQPAGAAGLADRDRGGCGDRLKTGAVGWAKRKRAHHVLAVQEKVGTAHKRLCPPYVFRSAAIRPPWS